MSGSKWAAADQIRMKVKPCGAFLLIRRDPVKEKVYTGGITVRAGVIYDRLVPATVCALGSRCSRFELKIGDKILVHTSSGASIMIGEKEHHLIREIDVHAMIVNDNEEES